MNTISKIFKFRHFNALAFIALCLIFIVMSHLNWNDIHITNTESDGIIDGSLANHIEQQYDKAFSAREFAISFWAAISYTLFNEGKEGVKIGKENWLFTSEEFENTELTAPSVNQRLNTILQTRDTLAQSQTKLVVTVVPAKARVYASKSPEQLPTHAQSRYTDFMDWLEQYNIQSIGLLPALNSRSTETFLKQDTHWSPFGASASAHYIAEQLSKFYPNEFEYEKERFETEKLKEHTSYQGDLLNYIPLSPYFSFLLPAQDSFSQYHTTDSAMDLFGNQTYEVVLVGTSYSAKPEWNFVGSLQASTGLAIQDMSQVGSGPFTPMQDYLNSEEFKETKPKLVIWEIPERYLVINPEQSQGNSL